MLLLYTQELSTMQSYTLVTELVALKFAPAVNFFDHDMGVCVTVPVSQCDQHGDG